MPAFWRMVTDSSKQNWEFHWDENDVVFTLIFFFFFSKTLCRFIWVKLLNLRFADVLYTCRIEFDDEEWTHEHAVDNPDEIAATVDM